MNEGMAAKNNIITGNSNKITGNVNNCVITGDQNEIEGDLAYSIENMSINGNGIQVRMKDGRLEIKHLNFDK